MPTADDGGEVMRTRPGDAMDLDHAPAPMKASQKISFDDDAPADVKRKPRSRTVTPMTTLRKGCADMMDDENDIDFSDIEVATPVSSPTRRSKRPLAGMAGYHTTPVAAVAKRARAPPFQARVVPTVEDSDDEDILFR